MGWHSKEGLGERLLSAIPSEFHYKGRKQDEFRTPNPSSKQPIHRCARLGPAGRVQAEPIPTTNPPAQVTEMAFAWSKNQTPSNYYYYSGHPLSTSALLRLGGRFGSCLGHPECW